MILRTPPAKRRGVATSAGAFSGSPSSIGIGNRRRLIEEGEEERNTENRIVAMPVYHHHQRRSNEEGEGEGEGEEEEEEEEDGDSDSMRCSYKCRQMVKSELLDTLDTQGKLIFELESKLRSLQEEKDFAEAQQNSSMLQINLLEQQLAASTGREEAINAKFTTELERAENIFRVQLKRCSELESKLQEEMKLRSEVELKATTLEGELETLKETHDRTLSSYKQEFRSLKEGSKRLEKDSEFKVSRIQAENSAEKGRLKAVQTESEALKAQIKELQKQLSESTQMKCEVEQKLATASLQVTSDDSGAETIIKHLRTELRLCEADVTEARKLKQHHVNVELLKEKLESERQRAERAEAALGNLAELEIEVKNLRSQLQAWESLVHELPGVKSRDDIPRKIADLQREAMSGMAQLGEATARVKELQVALSKAENAKHEAELNGRAAKEEANEEMLELKRLERKVQLLTKERDGLKSILASYDEEEAAIEIHQKKGEAITTLYTPDKAKEKRIQELEALISNLEREGDLLRAEIGRLENKLGRGEYDPTITKVLHMVDNLDVDPEKQALKMEIQNLRDKMQMLETKASNPGTNEDISENEISSNGLSLLKQQVNNLQKRESRYRKVFAEKIYLFRQACCLLFGYKVDMKEEQQSSTGIPVTVCTIQSIYAQNENEILEFQYESSNMTLRANDYATSPDISRMVEVLLKNFNSIPSFTANLTVELFNKTTLG